MAEVSLEQVGKIYPNGVQAVRDLSLDVADGEFLVLVGPSGCGKTTTLRLVAGLERPTTGLLRIAGKVVNDVAPRQRGVGMAFQRPALYPHLSVRANLAFGLRLAQPLLPWRRLFRRPDDADGERRVADTARLLGLTELLDLKPGQLSGGQQQRVALGRALVRRPGVLLLDEPLSNLDSALRLQLRRELHLLHRHFQATIMYVTHDPVEAMTLADRLAVMDAGIVQQVDRPQEVYERPRNRFVAGFLGPMNFLDGQVSRTGEGLVFVSADLKLPLPAAKACWADYQDRPTTLGIRPQDVQLGIAAVAGSSLPAEVALVERCGGNALVTLGGERWRLTSLSDRAELVEGQQVMMSLHLTRAHLFDRHGGQSLDVGFRGG